MADYTCPIGTIFLLLVGCFAFGGWFAVWLVRECRLLCHKPNFWEAMPRPLIPIVRWLARSVEVYPHA